MKHEIMKEQPTVISVLLLWLFVGLSSGDTTEISAAPASTGENFNATCANVSTETTGGDATTQMTGGGNTSQAMDSHNNTQETVSGATTQTTGRVTSAQAAAGDTNTQVAAGGTTAQAAAVGDNTTQAAVGGDNTTQAAAGGGQNGASNVSSTVTTTPISGTTTRSQEAKTSGKMSTFRASVKLAMNYSAAMSNLEAPANRELVESCKNELTKAYQSGGQTIKTIVITGFSKGSLVVAHSVVLLTASDPGAVTKLLQNFRNYTTSKTLDINGVNVTASSPSLLITYENGVTVPVLIGSDPCLIYNSNNLCENGGKCQVIYQSVSCYCKRGFQGSFCEVKQVNPTADKRLVVILASTLSAFAVLVLVVVTAYCICSQHRPPANVYPQIDNKGASK